MRALADVSTLFKQRPDQFSYEPKRHDGPKFRRWKAIEHLPVTFEYLLHAYLCLTLKMQHVQSHQRPVILQLPIGNTVAPCQLLGSTVHNIWMRTVGLAIDVVIERRFICYHRRLENFYIIIFRKPVKQRHVANSAGAMVAGKIAVKLNKSF